MTFVFIYEDIETVEKNNIEIKFFTRIGQVIYFSVFA